MSFLAISDCHLGKSLYGIPELTDDLSTAFINACSEAVVQEVKYLIIVGDLFETDRPSPQYVNLVLQQFEEIKAMGVTPVYFSGDHDTNVYGYNWSDVLTDKTHDSTYFGIHYTGDQEKFFDKLNAKNLSKTKFIFCHGMVPELWQFVEEKKRLNLKDWWLKNAPPMLEGIILGDIHKPLEDRFIDLKTGKSIYVGYCGSTGITNIDEINDKKRYLVYKNKLEFVPYNIPRKIGRFNIDTLIEYQDVIFEELKAKKTFPLFFVDYKKDQINLLSEIDRLKQFAFVKFNRVTEQSGEIVSIQKDTLVTQRSMSDILSEFVSGEDVLKLGLDLLGDLENATATLQNFTKAQIT